MKRGGDAGVIETLDASGWRRRIAHHAIAQLYQRGGSLHLPFEERLQRDEVLTSLLTLLTYMGPNLPAILGLRRMRARRLLPDRGAAVLCAVRAR
jgi:hypothetical protein